MPHTTLANYIRAHRPSARAVADLEALLSAARHTSTLVALHDDLDADASAPGSELGLTLAPDSEPEERARFSGPGAHERYEDLGPLGEGAMGEVRRVRDRDLNRTMAMKVIRADLMKHPSVLARFIAEAQCSAQLQHPGIVPVHELGRTPDGRVYFTMREVRGRTFGDIIAEVHAASPKSEWHAAATGWTFRRLVDAFVKVCEAVGYAHAKGVVHRDLKPENVMVGDFGEVLVVDWGLAKVRGVRDRAAEAGDLDVVVTDRSAGGGSTRVGVVAGTPAYMPPEQARGEVDRIDARSDVYALGAMLYEILSGRPPYEGSSGQAVLRQVLAGPPEPPGRLGGGGRDTFLFGGGFDGEAELSGTFSSPGPKGPPLPDELVVACRRAMSREPGARHGDAADLAAEATSWLEGARRREQALEVVAQAAATGPEIAALQARVVGLRAEAAVLLADVQPWEPEERKAPGWSKEDEAVRLERQAEGLVLAARQRLNGVLQIDPGTPEAHAALAQRHAAAHVLAEGARDDRAAAREEALLAAHVAALPEGHDVRGRCAAYLTGTGALTLLTDPTGAKVDLYSYELKNRRLVPVFDRSLGTTPLRAMPLAMGSYLCVLRHPDRAEVRYPVSIGRGEHWDGVAPGEAEARPVVLLRTSDLGLDDCYVPAGWFWSGGDPDVADGLPRRRLWSEGLVVRRFPVTNREYLAFLNDLVEQGREDEALLWVPRERAGALGELGVASYGRDESGRFALVVDAEGDAWLPDWPVINVDFSCAVTFARWAAERERSPWRLPGELEWEKAARGVDGRFFPWGDVLDGSWCCWRDSHARRPLPAVVHSFPVDESAYGVRGIGGNVEDWCADLYRREGPDCPAGRVVVPSVGEVDMAPSSRRARRGGNWLGPARNARCSSRHGYEPANRNANLGFRLARSVPLPDYPLTSRIVGGDDEED